MHPYLERDLLNSGHPGHTDEELEHKLELFRIKWKAQLEGIFIPIAKKVENKIILKHSKNC